MTFRWTVVACPAVWRATENVIVWVPGGRLTVKSVLLVCPFTVTTPLFTGANCNWEIWFAGRPAVLFAVKVTRSRPGPSGVVVTFTLPRWSHCVGTGVVCGHWLGPDTPMISP